MKTKVCVIGGSGFLGTKLIDVLLKRHQVTNIDKSPSIAHPTITRLCDVRDLPRLTELTRDHDIVVLLAAEHRDNVAPESLYRDVNVQGMHNTLAAMASNRISKIIFTSTVAIYGLNSESPPCEDTPPQPFNAYGKSKLEAEQLLTQWSLEDNVRSALILRPTVIFGPNNRGNVYNLIKLVSKKRFVMIGSGTNKKSLAFVDNVAALMDYLLPTLSPGVSTLNYADTPHLSVREIVDAIRAASTKGLNKRPPSVPFALGLAAAALLVFFFRVVGRETPISPIRVRKFCSQSVIDCTKLSRTGFRPPTKLRDALAATVAFEAK